MNTPHPFLCRMSARRLLLSVLLAVPLGALSGDPEPHPADARPKAMLAREAVFVAFDVETTGLSPARDRIVEIAAVKFKGGKVLDSKSWLVNPGRPIPPGAQAVHGITDEMVADKPAFPEIREEILAFLGDAILIAHNARFDLGFVREELLRAGSELPRNIGLDSLVLFRRWYPEIESHRLEAVADHVGVGGEGYHRALDDSRFLMEIFVRGLRGLKAGTTVEDVARQAGGALSLWQEPPAQ